MGHLKGAAKSSQRRTRATRAFCISLGSWQISEEATRAGSLRGNRLTSLPLKRLVPAFSYLDNRRSFGLRSNFVSAKSQLPQGSGRLKEPGPRANSAPPPTLFRESTPGLLRIGNRGLPEKVRDTRDRCS